MKKYVIIVVNTASPFKDNPVFLLCDEDENTIEFKSRDKALMWISKNKRAPFGYAVVEVGKLDFTYC